MIWAYDTRGNAVQMIGRASALVPGTCGAGCWPEKQPNGQILCVCGDTLLKARAFVRRRSLSGGVWEGTAAPVAAVLATAAVAFGAVYWFRTRTGRR